MSNDSYTTCQAKALTLLYGKENIFLTGAAGTGKSWLITRFLANKNRKQFPIVASTGTAALLVDGRTFHSFFGLGVMEGGMYATVQRAITNKRLQRRIQQAECIILDEVSMLSGETLATAEEIACELRQSDEPWGGLRIIAVGDFAQLPPVTRGSDVQDWAFLHPVWRRSNFVPVHLETTVRTTEADLLGILNKVRIGQVDEEMHTFFESRTLEMDQEFDGTRLFAHRRSVDLFNQQQLERIERPSHTFITEYKGSAQYVDRIKRDCPVPEFLTLKNEALVMLRKNDTAFPYKYVNGSLAHVQDMTEDTLFLKLLSGKTIELQKQYFALYDGHGQERASAYNFPVTLAWAATIHKAQGASIDRLLVDLSHLWEPGQAYVALSRTRTVQGLHISSWQPQSIIADPAVQEFYQGVQKEWKIASESIAAVSLEITEKLVERKREPKKKANYLHTYECVQKKQSLADISLLYGWKESTIINHIAKCIQEGKAIDIAYLQPENAIFGPIADVIEQRGATLLKPIFEQLNGEFSYNEIRLVQLCMMQEEYASVAP